MLERAGAKDFERQLAVTGELQGVGGVPSDALQCRPRDAGRLPSSTATTILLRRLMRNAKNRQSES